MAFKRANTSIVVREEVMAIGTQGDGYQNGRLKARPDQKSPKINVITGVQPLNLDGKRDGFIYVPASYQPSRPAALAVMLHGAGGQAQHGLSLLKEYADDHNIILLAPASRAQTWDVIAYDGFGPDVKFIDQALTMLFEKYAIDTSRLAIGGFSDGASYALSMGLTNGDLFTHILAFSPGFVHTIETKGKPAVFISHGTKDRVLPIDPCSRRIVPQLKRLGLQVNYQEFDGEHTIPASISRIGVTWFTKEKP
jgi:predicted esterase